MPRVFNIGTASVEECLGALERVLVLVELGAELPGERRITFRRNGDNQALLTARELGTRIKEIGDGTGVADRKRLKHETVDLLKDLFGRLKGDPSQVHVLRDACWLSVRAAREKALRCLVRADEYLPISGQVRLASRRSRVDDLAGECNRNFEGQVEPDGSLTAGLASWRFDELKTLVSLRARWAALVRACGAVELESEEPKLHRVLFRLNVLLFVYSVGDFAGVALPASFEGQTVNRATLQISVGEVMDHILRPTQPQFNSESLDDLAKWSKALRSRVLNGLRAGRQLAKMRDVGWNRLGVTLLGYRELSIPAGASPIQLIQSHETLKSRIDPDGVLAASEVDELAHQAGILQHEWATSAAWPLREDEDAKQLTAQITKLAMLTNRWEKWNHDCEQASPETAARRSPPHAHADHDDHDDHAVHADHAEHLSYLEQLGLHSDVHSWDEAPPDYSERSLRRGRAQLGLVTPRRARMYQL